MHFTDIISQGLDTIACNAGIEARYYRGEQWQKMQMIPTTKVIRGVDSNGVLIETRRQDFQISVNEFNRFRIEGETTIPLKNDKIKVDRGGRTITYLVGDAGSGEGVWRYVGSGTSHIRIHATIKADAQNENKVL